MIAGHHTLLGKPGADKPPWDWSMETAMATRLAFYNSLPQVTSLPTTIKHTTASNVSYNFFNHIPLWSLPGKIGAMRRTSSSSGTMIYSIFDPMTGTFTETGTHIDTSSSNAEIHLCRTIDGRLLAESRYQGKVYVLNEDGSNMSYVGQTNTSHNTNDGYNLYANYDGTASDVDAGARTYYIIDRNLNITHQSNLNAQYPHNYIKVPGYIATLSANAYLCVWTEDGSSQLITNRSVGQYAMGGDSFKVFPQFPDTIFFGAQIRDGSGTGYPIGVNLKTLTNVTSSAQYMGVDGQSTSTILPTGQWFYKRASGWYVNGSWYGLYNPVTDTHIRLETTSAGESSFRGLMYTLADGTVFHENFDGTNWEYRVYDFGFPKKYYPMNLITGPFGYNRYKF